MGKVNNALKMLAILRSRYKVTRSLEDMIKLYR